MWRVLSYSDSGLDDWQKPWNSGSVWACGRLFGIAGKVRSIDNGISLK